MCYDSFFTVATLFKTWIQIIFAKSLEIYQNIFQPRQKLDMASSVNETQGTQFSATEEDSTRQSSSIVEDQSQTPTPASGFVSETSTELVTRESEDTQKPAIINDTSFRIVFTMTLGRSPQHSPPPSDLISDTSTDLVIRDSVKSQKQARMKTVSLGKDTRVLAYKSKRGTEQLFPSVKDKISFYNRLTESVCKQSTDLAVHEAEKTLCKFLPRKVQRRSPTKSKATEFTLFPKLPGELKNIIWNHAIDELPVVVGGPKSPASIWAILHACRDSRSLLLPDMEIGLWPLFTIWAQIVWEDWEEHFKAHEKGVWPARLDIVRRNSQKLKDLIWYS